jgi:rhamnosyltransferase
MSAPEVSIVLPTRNGAATLPALLDALWAQKTGRSIEIIAVDSGSTDATVEILAPRVQTLVRINQDEFDHGATRNLGIERARGDFVVLLVQDALPVSEGWLATLTDPLRADPTLAGTFARQQSRPDASALTRDYLLRWVAATDQPWTSRLTGGAEEFARMTPTERLMRCTFDNVASCVRRSVWRTHQFAATSIAEDLEWSRDVLLAGYGIAFVPGAVVTHSHDRSARYEFARTRLLHERLYQLFELQTIPTLPLLARAMASSLVRHVWCERETPAQWSRAGTLAMAWPLGQYLGARSGRAGRPPSRLKPGRV